MRKVVRRLLKAASDHLSHERKLRLKAVAKRFIPPRARARLRRALNYVQSDARAGHRPTAADRALNEQSHKLNKDVAGLSRALWMGFTTDAVADLERIRRAGAVPSKPIARAAETLARWYVTNNQHDIALDRLIHARVLNGRDHPERLRVLEHHVLVEMGLFDEANQLFEAWGSISPDFRLVQANLHLREAEAGILSRKDADRKRMELIDWVFRQHFLTPLSDLVGNGVLEFSSLENSRSINHADVDAGAPVVSIVVPAFNAEATLVASVNSMRAQTVTNIEILIVDDASTDNTGAVAKALAADDPRIKVLQHPQNQGAYGARNTGLANAVGEYVTVHDSDDWSHPQLLERQLDVLKDGRAAGSFSRLARVSPQLEFLLRPYRPMLEPIHWNYTSLLVKTELMRSFGGWDTVRAHADSELIERLRRHYGKKSLIEAEKAVPLSFFLVTGGNLTENKATSLRSVDFGARREYSEQARYWRKKTFGEREIPSLNGHRRSSEKLPFFCARSLATNRDQISLMYDLVIGSDLGLQGGTRRCNLAYIDCARKLGLRVGIFNMPRYRLRRSGVIDETYRDLFQLDGVDLLTPDAEVIAKTLLVHHPPVLGKSFDGYPTISADKHYLLVNQLPWEMKDYSHVQYQVPTVSGHYRDAFGVEPIWIPISPRVRRYLSPELAPDAIHDEDWYPIVSWNASAEPRRAETGRSRPVVGRHSRDHATKWPEDAKTLEECYLAGTEYQVRLLGGTRAAEDVLGYRPKNWLVYPFDSVSVEEFLAEMDIFIHFHHSMYIEEFGRNIAEAMACGIPCVLPTEYTETFGESALYAEPSGVVDAIRELWEDPDRYYDFSQLGISFVENYSALEIGMKRIASLLD